MILPNIFEMRFLCVLIMVAQVHVNGKNLSQDTWYTREVKRQAKAAEISSFMKQNVDPCQDFYKFSCGNYDRINSASNHNVLHTGIFETLTEAYDRKILKMLNTPTDEHDTAEDLQVKHFYESCLEIKNILPNYPEKLRSLISEFGTMPVLEGDSWQEDDFDWVETAARMAHSYGISSLMGLDVSKDIANNSINRIYLGEQNFPLESRSMYIDNETQIYRTKYQGIIKSYLETFLGVENALAQRTAKDLINFEVDLARGLVDESDGLDMKNLTELISIAEMNKRYAPTLDISRLVSITLDEEVTDDIYEFNAPYLRNLVEVLKRTPSRTVANYMYFRLVFEFSVVPANSPEKQKKDCLTIVKKIFAKNLDNMFYRRYNNDKSSAEIESIWRQLKATFRESLRSSPLLDWIERPIRNLAIAKLEAMTLQVSNYVDHNFTAEFEGLNLQSTDYVENLRQIYLLAARKNRHKLHQPVEPLEAGAQLSYTPANILVENTIKVPVSLLQPFYIWADVYPFAIRFGSLASLIGHELIHGFDDAGRGFDSHGNAYDWWDERSSNSFQDRRKCFTRQYGNYAYDGIQLKKSIAQSENIADNGGVRLAYTAYRKWYDEQLGASGGALELEEERLPTLNYSGLQLFFISFAQTWCNDVHSSLKAMQVSTDQHMPGQIRVIGSLSNFDKFSEVFQCPKGSPMNPAEKCVLY
ncbi:neprilysin-4-like [Drosophila bipectinata]|uniref:neprilysin-4-like n=1 Tax=Drosophila bipectinata TaxID=42026 RepID=UPI001C897747|nr:neprilysin-4-like [Drosophila bipectinata]